MAVRGMEYVGISFCRECGSSMEPMEDKQQKKLMFVCRVCGWSEYPNSPCVYSNRTAQRMDELKLVNPDVMNDPTLPRTAAHQCVMCGNCEAVFFQSHSHVSEAEMRLFYVCTNTYCRYKWTY